MPDERRQLFRDAGDRRASKNPDGVVFYKMWNGRAKPKVPTVKDEITKEQVWQIVRHVQTLRQK